MEIYLNNYNEMLRYEKDMDKLRALALWITTFDGSREIASLPNPREYVFELIKMYSLRFAEDILEFGRIGDEALSLFHSSLTSIYVVLGISEEDEAMASEQQRFRNCGFWEMRRVIGQFGDMAEEIIRDGIVQIVTAGVSGCVIGEYLGLKVAEFGRHVRVDHMVFAREGINPSRGMLSDRFQIVGRKILLVDDAVMEAVTLGVMMDCLKRINNGVRLSVLTVDISEEVKSSWDDELFDRLYMFEE